MERDRRIAVWPYLFGLIALLLVFPLGLYVGGYFYLAEASTALVMGDFESKIPDDLFEPLQ